MAPHSSTLAWKIPWTEEPGNLQSVGSLRSDRTERLHVHFSLSCIGEGNGNPLQYSCLENPRDRGAWWAAIYGVAQSQTRLKRLSNSSVKCFRVGTVVKNPPANTKDARDEGPIPVLGRSPRVRNLPTHSSILAWKIPWMKELVGYCPWGCKEPDMTEQLNTKAKRSQTPNSHYQLIVMGNFPVCPWWKQTWLFWMETGSRLKDSLQRKVGKGILYWKLGVFSYLELFSRKICPFSTKNLVFQLFIFFTMASWILISYFVL